MYALIDPDTKRLVGQAIAIYSEDRLIFIPIDKELYVSLMETPHRYKEYLGVLNEEGVYKLRFCPSKDFSDVTCVELPVVTYADIWLDVRATSLTLRSDFGIEPLEVTAFLDGDLAKPMFYELLEPGHSRDHNFPEPKRLRFFISKPAIGYKYGVIYK